jgi:hypothetical protein
VWVDGSRGKGWQRSRERWGERLISFEPGGRREDCGTDLSDEAFKDLSDAHLGLGRAFW